MTDVFANGRSILHKGHGKTHLAVAPDVCKTPTPGGPVPIPYPNFSADSNLIKGAKTVKINGNEVANIDSQLSRSNGDEAGTLGGVVSSRNMGAFGWPVGSIDVEAEGKGIVRLLDSILTNGNAYNDTGLNLGEPGIGYGDDAVCPRADCKLERVIAKHRLPEKKEVKDLCAEFVKYVDENVNLKKARAGRMVGVGVCECGGVYKAISGPPLPPDHPLVGDDPNFRNSVGAALPGDRLWAIALDNNPTWSCAALKILNNAGSHTIVALSEKWVGKEHKGRRIPKTFSIQSFIFPINIPGLPNTRLPATASDKIPGLSEDPIPHGGSVPSCGTCQTLLPALVCEMKPCPKA